MIGEALTLNTTLTVPPPRLTQAPALLLRPSYPLHATTSPPLSQGCGSAYISVPNHPLPPILSLSLQPPFPSSLAKHHLSLHLKFVSHPLFHHCNRPSATPVPSRLLLSSLRSHISPPTCQPPASICVSSSDGMLRRKALPACCGLGLAS